MNVIEQVEQIDAILLAQGREWKMLTLLPDNELNMKHALREHVFQFRVVNDEGFAQPILVSRSNFAICPLLVPVTISVKYYSEEEVATRIQEKRLSDDTLLVTIGKSSNF